MDAAVTYLDSGPVPPMFDGGVGAVAEILHHDMPSFDVMPGQNIYDQCQSWTLHNETPLWLHRVEMTSAGSFHHSNWTFMPDDMFVGPDGTWPCADRSYDEITAGVAGGVFFAQSTQAAHEVMEFPEGDAIFVPAHTRVIGGVHLLNVTSAPVHTNITFDVTTYSDSQVRTSLQPLYIDYLALALPARAQSSFSTSCDMRGQYRHIAGRPIDFHIVYVLPHFHTMATDWQLTVVGGPHDGEAIYSHGGGVGDPLGMTLSPPYDLTGAYGVQMTCTYDNGLNHEVTYGIGAQSEMCTMLAYTDGPVKFVDVVSNGTNTVGPTLPDGTVTNTGPCGVIGFMGN